MKTRRELLVASLAVPFVGVDMALCETDRTVAPTRLKMLECLARCTRKTGEIPHIGRMSLGTFVKLAEECGPQGTYQIPPDGAGGHGYTALDIAGVPFYADPDFDEDGFLLLIHTTNPKACGKFSGLDYLKI